MARPAPPPLALARAQCAYRCGRGCVGRLCNAGSALAQRQPPSRPASRSRPLAAPARPRRGRQSGAPTPSSTEAVLRRQVVDVTVLALPCLEEVRLEYNRVRDASALAALPALAVLDMSANVLHSLLPVRAPTGSLAHAVAGAVPAPATPLHQPQRRGAAVGGGAARICGAFARARTCAESALALPRALVHVHESHQSCTRGKQPPQLAGRGAKESAYKLGLTGAAHPPRRPTEARLLGERTAGPATPARLAGAFECGLQ